MPVNELRRGSVTTAWLPPDLWARQIRAMAVVDNLIARGMATCRLFREQKRFWSGRKVPRGIHENLGRVFLARCTASH